MKTLVFFILTLLTAISAKAAIITVKIFSVRNFKHALDISTRQAFDSTSMEFFGSVQGKNTLIFDFDKKTLIINDQEPCAIIEIGKSDELVDCAIIDNGVKVYFTLGEKEMGDFCFVSKWEWEGRMNGYCASATYQEFYFTLENEFSHIIDFNHFDNKFLERLVFEELNRYRDSLEIPELLWSDAVYKYLSCKQTDIVAKGRMLYHPDINAVFTKEFRIALAKESQRITGIKSAYNCSEDAVTYMAENAFAWDLVDIDTGGGITYERLARVAIKCWDKSTEGHKEAQQAPYLARGGGKGFVAFSARVNDANNRLFIYCDFSMVSKENLELQTETH
jgi:hypothetical protein